MRYLKKFTDLRIMSEKMIISFLVCFSMWIFSTSAEFPNHGLDESSKVNWAFKKNALVDQPASYSGKDNYIRLKNYDFGSFGASKISLEINSAAALNNIKEKVSIHFDNAENAPADLFFNANSSSIKNNTLTFDITAPEGVHDVYISTPSEAKFKDFKSVEFHTTNPTRGQWYYFINKISSRGFDLCGDYPFKACTYRLRPYYTQKFRFEKDAYGGFRIVPNYPNNVLSVANWGTGTVKLEPFYNMPYQIWYILANNEGYELHPKHDISKCLDLYSRKDYDGAPVGLWNCNSYDNQIWYIIKAC